MPLYGELSQTEQDNLRRFLKGTYAEVVSEKYKRDPNYDIEANIVKDLEEAKARILDEGKEGSQVDSTLFKELSGPGAVANTWNTFISQAKVTDGQLKP